jgi:hypothetical protein
MRRLPLHHGRLNLFINGVESWSLDAPICLESESSLLPDMIKINDHETNVLKEGSSDFIALKLELEISVNA